MDRRLHVLVVLVALAQAASSGNCNWMDIAVGLPGVVSASVCADQSANGSLLEHTVLHWNTCCVGRLGVCQRLALRWIYDGGDLSHAVAMDNIHSSS